MFSWFLSCSQTSKLVSHEIMWKKKSKHLVFKKMVREKKSWKTKPNEHYAFIKEFFSEAFRHCNAF